MLTRHYGCWENEQEVALLSVDVYPREQFPEIDQLIIYELFVPAALRNNGIGTRALRAAEELGRTLGFRKTMLHAKPLLKSRSQEDMVAWYERRGYRIVDRSSSKLEKILTS